MADQVKILSLYQIEHLCRKETENFRSGYASDPQFCLEIFRRAVTTHQARALDDLGMYDEAAREVLYNIYTPFIESAISQSALFTLNIPRDDLVQETWFAFWRRAQHTLHFPSLPQALRFLRRVTQTTVLQALRASRSRISASSLDDVVNVVDIVDPQRDPFLVARQREFLQRVRTILGFASSEYRIFWLRYQVGLAPRDIAARFSREKVLINGLDATAASVSRLLNTSMQRLAEDAIINDLLSND